MSNKINRDSPLVKSVLALDHFLAELERVGTKISSTDMMSDFDLEHIQKLMSRFAECAQAVSDEVTNLSARLRESQARAEGVAQRVSKQAELLNIRKAEQDRQLEQFRLLGERVRNLNTEISRFRVQDGMNPTREDQATLTNHLPVFESQLAGLIEELQGLSASARNSRMRSLERNAESLVQALQAVRKKLQDLSA